MGEFVENLKPPKLLEDTKIYRKEIEDLYTSNKFEIPKYISHIPYDYNNEGKIIDQNDGEIIYYDNEDNNKKVLIILTTLLALNFMYINNLIKLINNENSTGGGMIDVIELPNMDIGDVNSYYEQSVIVEYNTILSEKIQELKKRMNKIDGGNKKTKGTDKYTVKQLKTMAFVYNVKTTKKSNGKIVNLKSVELLAKLKRSKIIL